MLTVLGLIQQHLSLWILALSPPEIGYTLPVFACASAVAALNHLHNQEQNNTVEIDLIAPKQIVKIPIENIAKLSHNSALAITRSNPGDNLDITRNTPIWTLVEIDNEDKSSENPITIQGGEGIGKFVDDTEKAAIYRYAHTLLTTNLERIRLKDEHLRVTVILPEGKQLAERTSNQAFGIVEGLSLLGTSGIAQPLSTPGQLTLFQEELAAKAQQSNRLIFCVGENGLDLARQHGLSSNQLLKAANWLGPLLVAAGIQGIEDILLFGYHGKLLKLAGGIFHTHHHLADARLEILTAHAACQGLPSKNLQQIFSAPTADAALQQLRFWDTTTGSDWVENIYQAIAEKIDQQAQSYIAKHAQKTVSIGCALFDRERKIFVKSQQGKQWLPD